MQFSVLGPLGVRTDDGTEVEISGLRQRLLLAVLLARRGETVSGDLLVDVLWGDDQPARPGGALQSQISRLRRALGAAEPPTRWELATRSPGYALVVPEEDLDSARFEALLATAEQEPPQVRITLLADALALWRGNAYGEFTDTDLTFLEAIRLEELRVTAIEDHAETLLEMGRAGAVVASLEPFVRQHPLRERARAALMQALYLTGRQPDALRQYEDYRRTLAEELGLEPSGRLQRLEADILDHRLGGEQAPAGTVPAPAPTAAGEGIETGGVASSCEGIETGGAGSSGEGIAETDAAARSFSGLDRLEVRYLRLPDGRSLAYGTVGSGPPMVAVPAWITSLDLLSSGRDPRSSLLDRLAHRFELTLYDRWGTGMTGGDDVDYSLEYNAQELERVVEQVGGPVTLLAVSQAGPAAITVAHRRPELVSHLVLFGTYASGPLLFRNAPLRESILSVVRTHWGMGARLLAPLYRPGSSDGAVEMWARVLRDSAPGEVAVGYLETVYEADVIDLLPEVAQPALVLHYRDDRLIPFPGAQQLAAGLPDARFVPLDGGYHLPDATDLDRIVEAVRALVAGR